MTSVGGREHRSSSSSSSASASSSRTLADSQLPHRSGRSEDSNNIDGGDDGNLKKLTNGCPPKLKSNRIAWIGRFYSRLVLKRPSVSRYSIVLKTENYLSNNTRHDGKLSERGGGTLRSSTLQHPFCIVLSDYCHSRSLSFGWKHMMSNSACQ